MSATRSRDRDPSRRHHHVERRHRTRLVEVITTREPEPAAPPPNLKILSNIHPLQLEENIGGGRGNYASVSVLEPVMRVERSGADCVKRPGARPVYRIILSFTIQFTINRGSDE